MTTENSIKALAALHQETQASRAGLFKKAKQLEADLNAAFGDGQIYVTGNDTMLEYDAPGEGVYGRLCYDGEELLVLYRHSDEDMSDDAMGLAQEERSYHRKLLANCSQLWLDRVLAIEPLQSLLANLGAELNKRKGYADQSHAALDSILSADSSEINDQMTASLAALNSDAVAKNWQDALDATHVETADALTRSTRMLESVCAAILRERGVALPKDKSLSPLLKECLSNLGLPSLPELQPDLKQLLGGVASICGGAAALRTHFGTAHGATSHFAPLDAAFGVLAKNTCAAAAIFLIDRHKNGDGQVSQKAVQ
ncbi:TPA: abortive infection family protein [Burkholderia vietnamiensis]|uniref:abortive infection family protein n=1 Tax=Burkholderia vietnamiensis TaxID=60552 RepID=UPI00158DAD0E|nr:abortive infection family protein [Burkholderia vietnamiensis]MCA8210159.1 abortive infection family protein [Burkholderia vietnamiensis]HDR9018048.1 abortive infection family protein [Burkholderia vietnamiensis]HDR9101268.1 abortive infection family protein [Burkholderia vietnamiensis]HDR9121013.1 abortive infection family protein [Burkholderia vietnamiensis]